MKLGHWVAQKEMEDVCWFSYLAVCGALCVGALTRGLEGAGASANNSPFNLVCIFYFIFSLDPWFSNNKIPVWICVHPSYILHPNNSYFQNS